MNPDPNNNSDSEFDRQFQAVVEEANRDRMFGDFQQLWANTTMTQMATMLGEFQLIIWTLLDQTLECDEETLNGILDPEVFDPITLAYCQQGREIVAERYRVIQMHNSGECNCAEHQPEGD